MKLWNDQNLDLISVPTGHDEFQEFMISLPKKDRIKLAAEIVLIENEGLLVARIEGN